jgi:rod shape-determining protein MreC
MSARTAQYKAPGVLAILLLLQLVLMSMSARHPEGKQSILSNWLMAAITPVVKTLDRGISGISGAMGSFSELTDAREENAQLKKQIEELTAERDRAREEAAALEPLRNQLALPSETPYPQLAANVISRNAGNWFRHLVIDRGSLDGVKLNLPVATATGIVGRIIETGPNYSRVQLITDRHAGVGAMLQRSRAKGAVRGSETARCEMKSVSSSEQVEVGEVVVTTGLDGIYPKGLMIGAIERVDIDPNGPWHKLIITPAAPVDRVEHVFVLLVTQRDLKMQETIR